MSADDTIGFFKDGQYVGCGGFPPVGSAKVVAHALAKHVEKNKLQGKLRLRAFIGAASRDPAETAWGKQQIISHRYPYSDCGPLREQFNRGQCEYSDTHLSKFPSDFLYGWYTLEREKPGLDICIVEATEILPDGSLILSGAVGSSPELCYQADKIII
jgi:acetyl-CoA hydrolase